MESETYNVYYPKQKMENNEETCPSEKSIYEHLKLLSIELLHF